MVGVPRGPASPLEHLVRSRRLARGTETLDDDGRAGDLVGGVVPNVLFQPPEFDAGYLRNHAAGGAPDIQVRFQVQVVARGRFRPVLGAAHPDLLQHRERLVDGTEGHAWVLFLDDQVDVFGRRMTPGLLEGLEHRPALGGQGVPRAAELLSEVLYQHLGHLYGDVRSVTIPIPKFTTRHPPCGGVPLAQDVAFYRRFGEPLAPVAQRLRAASETAAGLRLPRGERLFAGIRVPGRSSPAAPEARTDRPELGGDPGSARRDLRRRPSSRGGIAPPEPGRRVGRARGAAPGAPRLQGAWRPGGRLPPGPRR